MVRDRSKRSRGGRNQGMGKTVPLRTVFMSICGLREVLDARRRRRTQRKMLRVPCSSNICGLWEELDGEKEGGNSEDYPPYIGTGRLCGPRVLQLGDIHATADSKSKVCGGPARGDLGEPNMRDRVRQLTAEFRRRQELEAPLISDALPILPLQISGQNTPVAREPRKQKHHTSLRVLW